VAGFQLVSREFNRITIYNMLTKNKEVFTLIAEFPFDSVRKRMSVILRDSEGLYQILCKGADNVMLDRIYYDKSDVPGLRAIIEEDLYQYSCEGLRTLMMGKRNIIEEEFQSFIAIYEDLKKSFDELKEEKLC
jgi:magnesium-transporting ATPase (P-type)